MGAMLPSCGLIMGKCIFLYFVNFLKIVPNPSETAKSSKMAMLLY